MVGLRGRLGSLPPRVIARRLLRWLPAVAAVALAAAVWERFRWIPVWYLAIVVAAPVAGWWMLRQRAAPPLRRWGFVSVAVVIAVAACPVPWMVAAESEPPGNAWRLDGRLSIDGRAVDPAGEWYWLTVGRPPTIAEVVWSRIHSDPSDAPMSMRSGALRQRARWAEPAAAVVGLARGGWPVGSRVEVHVRGATAGGLPDEAVIVALGDRTFESSTEWSDVVAGLDDDRVTFTTADGQVYGFRGPRLPYREVELVVVPTREIDVVVGGWMAGTPAGAWYRNLASGSSHGLMVALVAYTYASGEELGRGLSIAGTGTIRHDGKVGRIRGLVAKAGAARHAGADVLLFPASQAAELDGFRTGGMALVPVATIDDAIAALRARAISA